MRFIHILLALGTFASFLNATPVESDALLLMLAEGDGTVRCREATEAERGAFAVSEPRMKTAPIARPLAEGDGLQIVLRGTGQLDGFPAAKEAFERAAARWEAIIESPIIAVIDIDFGTSFFGTPFPPAAQGMVSMPIATSPWTTARAAFSPFPYFDPPPPTGNSIPTDFGAGNTLSGTTINFQLLGLLPSDGSQVHPSPAIGFNSAFPYDFDPSDGIDADRFDFEGRAVHEIGHALGLISRVGVRELNPTAPIAPSVWDLFRFRPGVTLATFSFDDRVLRAGGEQIFYAGSGSFPLSTARSDGTGGDGSTASHWKADELLPESPDRAAIGVMEPTARLGERLSVKAPDVLAMDVIGRIFVPLTAGGCVEQEPNERVPPFSPIGIRNASCRGEAVATDVGGITIRYSDGTSDAIEDLYEFTLAEPRAMEITLIPQFAVESQSADDFDLFLFRVAGNTITSLGSSATDSAIEHIETQPLPAGVYHVGVTAQAGGGPYRLRVSSTVRASSGGEGRRRPARRP